MLSAPPKSLTLPITTGDRQSPIPSQLQKGLDVGELLNAYRSKRLSNKGFLLSLSTSLALLKPGFSESEGWLQMIELLERHKSSTQEDVADAVDSLVAWCDKNNVSICPDPMSVNECQVLTSHDRA